MKKRLKPLRIIYVFTALFALISTSYLIYNLCLLTGIETLIRITLIIILIIVLAILLITGWQISKNKKKSLTGLYLISVILFIIIQIGIGFNINKMYATLNQIKQREIIYATSLIAHNDSTIKTIADVKKIKIGIINDEDSIEGYIISQDIIAEYNLSKKNNYLKYDNFITLINALYKGEVDVIFVPRNYITTFASEDFYPNIEQETTVIVTKEKRIKEKEKVKEQKITKPFTILIMGIDATSSNINTNANGDALMLITFNPNTLNATILSIPRDTFVYIAGKDNYQTKITHASWYGEKCMVATIEKLIDLKIDHYLKVNFQGLIKLVDALGGIEVDVPMKFCEQNSKRQKGVHQICLDKGVQRLNGEEALALARNRYQTKQGDISRGLHQQLILNAILNESKKVTTINHLQDILKVIEHNIATSFSTNQIFSLYNIGKDIINHNNKQKEPFAFQPLFLKTYTFKVLEGNNVLDTQAYFKGSLNDVSQAMKINLGLLEAEPIKTFTYSYTEPYVKKRIGDDNYYGETRLQVVPNFIGKTKADALEWGEKNNITLNWETITTSDPNYNVNEITNQNIPGFTLLSKINKKTGLTLTIIEKVEVITTPTKINCTLPENETEPVCFMPNFVNEKLSQVEDWMQSITANFIITKEKVITNEASDHLVILEQSVPTGTKVTAIGAELIIKYYFYETEKKEEPLIELPPETSEKETPTNNDE